MRVARAAIDGIARYVMVEGELVFPIVAEGDTATGDLISQGAFSGAAHEQAFDLGSTRLLAPVVRPGKIVAIGLNYYDHAVEGGMGVPDAPLVFAKFPSSIIGPEEAILWEKSLTAAVDFEAELALVIGRRARHVSPERALEHVAFYTCLNDVSARDIQFRDGQWVRGKSLDTFCPIGPWLVPVDELGDASALGISCTVSGQVMQSATTGDMIFGTAELVSRLSHSFVLDPGDIVATGTPPGVGWFRKPQRLLEDGDEVIVSIEGIGELRNTCRTVAYEVGDEAVEHN